MRNLNQDTHQNGAPHQSLTTGLSGKLLLLTVGFVFLAEILVFVPSMANMRLAWLKDRLNSALSVGRVIDGLPTELPREVQDATLHTLGVDLIAIRKDDTSRLLAATARPLRVDAHYDIRDVNGLEAIVDAASVLLSSKEKTMRVIGNTGDGSARIEIVLSSKPLRKAMMNYLRNVTMLAISLSTIVGAMIFMSFNQFFILPIRRLSSAMQYFSEKPDDPERIFKASEGRDELAIAAQHLSEMQESLQVALNQQKHMADLGLAVSKINHDMKNILASAQLMSDRLVDVSDPMVKSFAPRLVRTLDRAVSYTEEILAYGRSREISPKLKNFALYPVISEVKDIAMQGVKAPINFEIDIDPDFWMIADYEHVFRIIYNLSRNAVQAMEANFQMTEDGNSKVVVSARKEDGSVILTVDDNGPGLPDKARDNLFTAFKGSTRAGGTGLGLVIARELVQVHHGSIELVDKPSRGTQFRIEIPQISEI